MNADKQRLKGSRYHDMFKQNHKLLASNFYATDADLLLVEKNPPCIVAVLDYKHPNDSISFAEVIAYNALMVHVPIFIVYGLPDGPFQVFRYVSGNPRPNPPRVRLELVRTCADWREFEAWERALRRDYKTK